MKSCSKYLQWSGLFPNNCNKNEAFGQEEADPLCTIQQSPQPAWQPQKCIALNNLFPILTLNNILSLHQAYNVLGVF